ncbi:MAG: type I-C CRISPR-associated endonuclease Cas1 [Planctomycetaceae bacterium]|nr:type I-C CRISPR-associated endonuclease Cas1 [Planctomycetaceae bacterium]MBV8610740.1 type I-C CRISPR-associated endonuclease Cas1 [Singulisphaera sp.]MBV8269153.1 type I-C CRISPR-associated endonuclease Cas1 [Planctomycetaceae bacterium]MBV8314104.1 type I-C CRISPR-associated endonuclease Cas1 [Planctomycetaceae bacterium]MBV8384840.1 type I-C CRISPR-associated endonuclease Cas1 [Planctomycetaceae bacterium]
MDVQLNTLYIFTAGAYLHRDHQTVVVEIEKQRRLALPIHHLDAIAAFGPILVSPGLVELCVEAGVALSYLTDSGRLIARVDAPRSGNVLLRREQFRRADRPEACLPLARSFIAGKLQNARNGLLRAARESHSPEDVAELNVAAARLGEHVESLMTSDTLDSVRGREGDSARTYFAAFPRMIRCHRDEFGMNGRSRRPPLDPVNALLSFTYALMTHDCVAALTAAGLDPDVGFLHADRPGRPSLALDLVEEFRTLVADRLVLALINRRQIGPSDFVRRDGGAVEMSTDARKSLVQAYVARKRDEVTHPLLGTSVRIGQLPFLQAKLLARHLRGDSEMYIPCIIR